MKPKRSSGRPAAGRVRDRQSICNGAAMLDPARYVPLRSLPWNADEARAAIEDIVSDAQAHFDQEQFWPAHPLDDGASDGHTSFYFGATGVIWALDYLRRLGATALASISARLCRA
jgi:hypothetical protein